MTIDIKNSLLKFINVELLNDRANVTSEDELLMSGVVDSLGVMKLVAHLEGQLGVTVPPEDITIEHFSSIQTISDYVERFLVD